MHGRALADRRKRHHGHVVGLHDPPQPHPPMSVRSRARPHCLALARLWPADGGPRALLSAPHPCGGRARGFQGHAYLAVFCGRRCHCRALGRYTPYAGVSSSRARLPHVPRRAHQHRGGHRRSPWGPGGARHLCARGFLIPRSPGKQGAPGGSRGERATSRLDGADRSLRAGTRRCFRQPLMVRQQPRQVQRAPSLGRGVPARAGPRAARMDRSLLRGPEQHH
mmetsp:Transcript_7418/g.25236  ORF Transcript_7418/g.25236 Transcript_7418/m.25236 type:complete len:223 (-) Transcript_7418:70-738(-)